MSLFVKKSAAKIKTESEWLGGVNMKTRRFKALNGKGGFSRIVDKIAIYDNDDVMVDCCVIHCEPGRYDGREFYYPTNNYPGNNIGLFSGKPKDAIQCIKDGFGDCFVKSDLFGFTMEHVVRFVDRKYGEDIRRNTIEGWKNAKFAYAVKFTLLNSFSGGREVMKDKTLNWWGKGREDVLTFETELEAKQFIYEIEKFAIHCCEEYEELPITGDHDFDLKNIYDPFFEKMKKSTQGGVLSVYWHVFRAKHHDRLEGGNTYELEVVQFVLP